jgi:hypothetical protein
MAATNRRKAIPPPNSVAKIKTKTKQTVREFSILSETAVLVMN